MSWAFVFITKFQKTYKVSNQKWTRKKIRDTGLQDIIRTRHIRQKKLSSSRNQSPRENVFWIRRETLRLFLVSYSSDYSLAVLRRVRMSNEKGQLPFGQSARHLVGKPESRRFPGIKAYAKAGRTARKPDGLTHSHDNIVAFCGRRAWKNISNLRCCIMHQHYNVREEAGDNRFFRDLRAGLAQKTERFWS